MTINHASIKKILVISLSNIGDIILTLPVMDVLHQNFPKAAISVVVGPKGSPLFKGNNDLAKIYVFQKRQHWLKTLRFLGELRRENFDWVVDLRNTAMPFFIAGRYRTSYWVRRIKGQHVVDQHLDRLRSLYAGAKRMEIKSALTILAEDKVSTNNIIRNEVGDRCPYVVLAPGAADGGKCWAEARFAAVSDALARAHNLRVVLVGDERDILTGERVRQAMTSDAVNLCGRLSLTQLAVLIEKSFLFIGNDSAPMHLASYLDVPVVGIFGPTDPARYGPWSRESCVVEKKAACPICQGQQEHGLHVCLDAVQVDDVLSAIMIKDGTISLGRPRAQEKKACSGGFESDDNLS